MTAPTNPSIAESAPLGIVGTSAPNKILETEGQAVNMHIENEQAMTIIKKRKNASSFLTPK